MLEFCSYELLLHYFVFLIRSFFFFFFVVTNIISNTTDDYCADHEACVELERRRQKCRSKGKWDKRVIIAQGRGSFVHFVWDTWRGFRIIRRTELQFYIGGFVRWKDMCDMLRRSKKLLLHPLRSLYYLLHMRQEVVN